MEAAVFTLTLFLLLTVTNRDDVSFTEIFLPHICGTVTSKHSEGFYRSSGRERSPAGFLEVPLHRRSDRRHQDFHHSPENCGKYIIHSSIHIYCICLKPLPLQEQNIQLFIYSKQVSEILSCALAVQKENKYFVIYIHLMYSISVFGETQLPNTSSKILEINPFILISLTMITVWFVY